MDKEDIFKMAEKYASITTSQLDYMAGFQAACNIIRQKMKTCDNEEFCYEMEELSNVSFMDLSYDY